MICYHKLKFLVYTPMMVLSIVLKSGLLTVTHQLRENNVRTLGCKLFNAVRAILLLNLNDLEAFGLSGINFQGTLALPCVKSYLF